MERTSVELEDATGQHALRATGQVVLFPGYLALYEEGRDDETDEDSRRLPRMSSGDAPAKKAELFLEQADIYDPVQRSIIRWEDLIEISEILAGKKEGRTKADEITFFKNNAGQGVADVALGAEVLEAVRNKGTGQTLNV